MHSVCHFFLALLGPLPSFRICERSTCMIILCATSFVDVGRRPAPPAPPPPDLRPALLPAALLGRGRELPPTLPPCDTHRRG